MHFKGFYQHDFNSASCLKYSVDSQIVKHDYIQCAHGRDVLNYGENEDWTET